MQADLVPNALAFGQALAQRKLTEGRPDLTVPFMSDKSVPTPDLVRLLRSGFLEGDQREYQTYADGLVNKSIDRLTTTLTRTGEIAGRSQALAAREDIQRRVFGEATMPYPAATQPTIRLAALPYASADRGSDPTRLAIPTLPSMGGSGVPGLTPPSVPGPTILEAAGGSSGGPKSQPVAQFPADTFAQIAAGTNSGVTTGPSGVKTTLTANPFITAAAKGGYYTPSGAAIRD